MSIKLVIPFLIIFVAIIPSIYLFYITVLLFFGLKDYGDRNRLGSLRCKYIYGFMYVEVKNLI